MILSSIIIIIIIALLSLIIIESNNLVVGAEMMKIHPLPLTRNITIQFGNNINPNFGKKLRRLPHVFTRVLELPFRSDADVTIHDDPDCFRFVAETDRIADVRAHTIEIHPGVIKIAVRVGPSVEFSLDQLEIDMWRFRLPESTQPELATAAFVDGELIVTVPKRALLLGLARPFTRHYKMQLVDKTSSQFYSVSWAIKLCIM
ncbi:PREDICTED: uncharacterized protein LOC109355268 isoform X2 [Lupinus angustifolius]|uniref:uncharacterized protein LOC109355268 isoform X2 n=2 Tax=Lupinus angustifolius TaxID=3871 RepID=UPI00092EB896|nr:PREDICTED: uncharacterized protein LOC109355268 isoform X2 [Lupinus angustifolius]